MTHSKYNSLRPAVMLFAAALLLSLPIVYLGMPGGNDLPQHYRFVYTFYEALQRGDLFPSWPGETNLGFGDVGIRFYPPLAYYVVAFFRLLTPDWATAFATAIAFWFFVGGVGTYLLARETLSEKASLVAALVFMAMPYHTNQVYNAGLFAEFAGLAILPFCLLFTHRTIARGTIGNIVGLVISYALLILTHLPMVIIGSIVLTAYGVLHLNRRNIRIALPKLAAAVVAALAASSFYWVRMVSELGLVQHTLPEYVTSHYDFRENFLAAILYMPADRYGETSAWFTDLLFTITLAMVVPAFVGLLLVSKNRRQIIPLVGVLAIAIILSTPLSLPLWDNVGTLQKIQFPWRFLGPISLIGALIIGGFVQDIRRLFEGRYRPVGLIAAGLLIAGVVFTGAQVIRPATYPGRTEFDSGFPRYRSDESYQCWWPIGARRTALANRDPVSSATRQVQIANWKDDLREFSVEPGFESTIRIATFYYPYWKVKVNGVALEPRKLEDGTIGIDLPSERSDVKLFFDRPRYETTSLYISAATWITLLLVFLAGLVINRRDHKLA